MDFETAKLSPEEGYKLIGSLVVPRPIALVSTLSRDGVQNAAPFSFFNAVGYDPTVVTLGLEHWPNGREKDTGRNIRDTGEFVINLVDEAIAERMNICALNFAPETDEFSESGFTPHPSLKIRPPGIAEAPVSS